MNSLSNFLTRERQFAAPRALLCALTIAGCSASENWGAPSPSTSSSTTTEKDEETLSFNEHEVRFNGLCDAPRERTLTIEFPETGFFARQPITLRIEGPNAFTFEDGTREHTYQAHATPLWIDILFNSDPANGTGNLEGTLIAENSVHTATIPIRARSASLSVTLEQIDTLPLLLGESSDLYRLSITNNGSAEEKIHLPGVSAPYASTKNDFPLAAGANEVITISATIADLEAPLRTFYPAVEVDGCQPISPTTVLAPEGWQFRVPYASSTPLVLARVFASGTYASADIDIGSVPCGSTAPAESIEVQNLTHAPIDVSLSFAKGSASPFLISQEAVHVEARSRVPLLLTPKPVPQYPLSAAADAFFDSLAVASASANFNVPIKEYAWGHRYSFNTGAIDFGNVAVGASSDRMLTVRDDGYISVASSPVFGQLGSLIEQIYDPTSHLVAPFESGDGALAVTPGVDTPLKITFRPSATGAKAADLTIGDEPKRVNCSPPPVVKLSGNGI